MFGPYDYIIFGSSWVAVGSVLIAVLRRVATSLSEEWIKVIAALWVVMGFILSKLYVGGAWQIPTAPEAIIALVLQAILVFGAVLGLAPGQTFGRVWGAVTRRV